MTIKFTTKVSSTLNRDAKSYGKKYLTDGNMETCWNSDQGLPQWIQMDLETPSGPSTWSTIKLMFQGGFAGKKCELLGQAEITSEGNAPWESLMFFYPDDVNSIQSFSFDPVKDEFKMNSYTKLRIIFHESTDFYGRITVYHLELE